MAEHAAILDPVLQAGFAGQALALLAVLIYTLRQFFRIAQTSAHALKLTAQAIKEQTATLRALQSHCEATREFWRNN